MKIKFDGIEFECESLRKMVQNKNVFAVIDGISSSQLNKDGILQIIENGEVIEELNSTLVGHEVDYIAKKTFLTFQYN